MVKCSLLCEKNVFKVKNGFKREIFYEKKRILLF